jgi:GR25 family glycosyltransferase involved in LPS biosynthesis
LTAYSILKKRVRLLGTLTVLKLFRYKLLILKKRLKEININYRILFGINGNLKKNHKKLSGLYNKRKTEHYIGRQLSFPEIAASYAHIKAYKIIRREKIKNAIIMEDDVYPSIDLAKWIGKKITIQDNFILSFNAYPALGFIYKKPRSKKINNSIAIHDSKTHLFNCSCYQINLNTSKKILKILGNKVCGFADWPFNLKKNNINLGVTLPYLNTFLNDVSNITSAREKLTKKSFNFKNKLPTYLQNLLRIFYYLSFFPFITKKYSNFDFYYEQFFFQYLQLVKNFFSRKYLDTSKIFYNKKYYSLDLQEIKRSSIY